MDEMLSFEEQLYRDMVDRAFKRSDTRSFSNGKTEHAAYLIRRFFDHAASTVRLHCGSLAKEMEGVQVYESPDLISSALDFLRRRDTRLLIVLQGRIDADSFDEHPLLGAIAGAEPAVRGTTRVYKHGIQMGIDGNRVTFPHFMVMDQKGYRIELDAKKVLASANVNDVSQSQRLAKFFDLVLLRPNEPADWAYPGNQTA